MLSNFSAYISTRYPYQLPTNCLVFHPAYRGYQWGVCPAGTNKIHISLARLFLNTYWTTSAATSVTENLLHRLIASAVQWVTGFEPVTYPVQIWKTPSKSHREDRQPYWQNNTSRRVVFTANLSHFACHELSCFLHVKNTGKISYYLKKNFFFQFILGVKKRNPNL